MKMLVSLPCDVSENNLHVSEDGRQRGLWIWVANEPGWTEVTRLASCLEQRGGLVPTSGG